MADASEKKNPDDYVIATGIQHTVREFVIQTAKELGLILEFKGKGTDEYAVIKEITKDKNYNLKIGQKIIEVDKKYFRPSEVDNLLGESKKVFKELGWKPKNQFK